MSDLTMIANVPEVKSAVLGDLAGGFLDAVREQDGETIAAVMGFVASALQNAGEQLGLGALQRVAVGGEASGCLLLVHGDAVVTARVEPGKALPNVEKQLDHAVHGKV